MNSLVNRIAQDAAGPFEQTGARLLKKSAFIAFGLACLLAGGVFLTLALNDYLRSLAGNQLAALTLGGVYLGLALISLASVSYANRSRPEADDKSLNAKTFEEQVKLLTKEAKIAQPNEPTEFARQIDAAVAPILDILHEGGLERERAALVAAAAVTKKLKPVTSIAFAMAAGFILGRAMSEPR